MFFCKVQVQDLLICLYGQHHDIYGDGEGHSPTYACRKFVLCILDILMYIYGLYHQVQLTVFQQSVH